MQKRNLTLCFRICQYWSRSNQCYSDKQELFALYAIVFLYKLCTCCVLRGINEEEDDEDETVYVPVWCCGFNAAKYMRLVESPSLNISEINQRTPSRTCLGEQPRFVASHLPLSDIHKDDVFQVSIHCQGCAGKVKKHLSKMAGVTSFGIDVEAKRVIVMGHVSPAWVLESLSKVKKTEIWTL